MALTEYDILTMVSDVLVDDGAPMSTPTTTVEREVRYAFHTTTAPVGNLTCIPYSPQWR